MTPEEATWAQVGIGYLHDLVPRARDFFLESQENPRRASAVAKAKRNRDLVLTLDASLLHDAAGDNFTTIVNEFIHGQLPRFSLYSVIRGALEADAWACWMLDPTVDDVERLTRALNLRSQSLHEMRRLGLPRPGRSGITPARHYSKRIKRVISAGRRWKLTLKKHKDGLVVLGSGAPKVTPLLRSLLPDAFALNKKLVVGEQVYGELSARAHGTTWALLHKLVAVASFSKYQNFGYSELDVKEFVRLLGVAVYLHDEATARMGELAGIDRNVWAQRRGEIPWHPGGGDLITPRQHT